MQFLVHVDIETPPELGDAQVDALRVAESARAAELANSGHLLRLWRVPGRWANWGLWDAVNEVALLELLDSLPLRRYMSVEVHPLMEHPNDP
jgi:muconolactone delta-isomerase